MEPVEGGPHLWAISNIIQTQMGITPVIAGKWGGLGSGACTRAGGTPGDITTRRCLHSVRMAVGVLLLVDGSTLEERGGSGLRASSSRLRLVGWLREYFSLPVH